MKNIKSRYFVIFTLASFLLTSCNKSKQKTFLDFELGMSYKEYINHANNLAKSGFITKLNNTDFNYCIKLPDNSYVYFKVHAYVYSNKRLSMIKGESLYHLSDNQKQHLYDVFVKKHGQTTEPYQKAYSTNIWRAVWDKNDIDSRIVFIDEDKDGNWETSIIYMATGNLSDNIEKLDKKERGEIEVENNY